MARILILSSFVAASRVGGSAQALALARLGIEPVLAPTVLFGRHPGHGPPGGAAVAAEIFEGVLAGIEAQGLFGALDAGSTVMQAATSVPVDITEVIQGLIVLFVAAPPLIRAVFRLRQARATGMEAVAKGWNG